MRACASQSSACFLASHMLGRLRLAPCVHALSCCHAPFFSGLVCVLWTCVCLRTCVSCLRTCSVLVSRPVRGSGVLAQAMDGWGGLWMGGLWMGGWNVGWVTCGAGYARPLAVQVRGLATRCLGWMGEIWVGHCFIGLQCHQNIPKTYT